MDSYTMQIHFIISLYVMNYYAMYKCYRPTNVLCLLDQCFLVDRAVLCYIGNVHRQEIRKVNTGHAPKHSQTNPRYNPFIDLSKGSQESAIKVEVQIVASELKDPIWHSLEWQIGSFSSEATKCKEQ